LAIDRNADWPGIQTHEGIDPLSMPPAAGYHAAFDRSALAPGTDPRDAGAADGQITVEDVVFVVAQFGHSCA
jgi:hypothetical protein